MNSLRNDLQEPLLAQARRAWQAIWEGSDELQRAALKLQLDNTVIAAQLSRVLACSPFVAETLRRKPQLLLDLLLTGSLQSELAPEQFSAELVQQLDRPDAVLHEVLRYYRTWHMVRIVWRDFCRLASTTETVRDTSLLAQACIAEALRCVQASLEQRYGQPIGCDSGERQQLIVLAMGKLGAGELNVSSDIDLIFAFPEAGKTSGGEKSLGNEQFFIKVGQALISALDQVTADGFVFRVDMRLRPYGDSGALVHNFSALEQYYQDQGRDWERYALIKARPITGDARRAQELVTSLRPFIYRRYVDFGVIESLRSMKQMINSEVRRRGLQNDVKLGHGGIREVEFIAQCFQLIRGGRDVGLQQRELLAVLHEAEVLNCLPHQVVLELRQAYLFLRDSEHAIQGYKDQQTQTLPDETLQRSAMALVMGFESWADYLEVLERHRASVARHFRELIAAPEDEATQDDVALPLWGEGLCEESLRAAGYNRVSETLHELLELQQSSRVLTLQVEGKERLEQFMPQLLRACVQVEDPDQALTRVLPLVVAVLRRSAYLALLLENPAALKELVLLCGASPWIAQQMARHPVLLDELLHRASLYTVPDKRMLQDELRQQVARLGEDDLEAQMDTLRYFKAAQTLRVAANEIAGRLPLMRVSDHLTWLAEVILEQVMSVAWADLSNKYGEPKRSGAGRGFAILGYGKLGGLELGYGSDLDLVFVHAPQRQGVTDGRRSIDNTVFYTRLGQRIIHIIETRMALGQLYEVDMRLRPSGDSGMLVTTTDGFRAYQKDTAWTWEHQALVRARFVAGDSAVAEAVDVIRREILCQPRDVHELAIEVKAMRGRMREHLLPAEIAADVEMFHLKHGIGGIVDIEFMVQYAVLAWSATEPELARWSDNVRILEAVARAGLFEQAECDVLTEAYLAYRSAAHQLSLQEEAGVVAAERFADFRAAVSGKWKQLFS